MHTPIRLKNSRSRAVTHHSRSQPPHARVARRRLREMYHQAAWPRLQRKKRGEVRRESRVEGAAAEARRGTVLEDNNNRNGAGTDVT